LYKKGKFVQQFLRRIRAAVAWRLNEEGIGVRFLTGIRYSSFHSIQTGSGVHPASYPVSTGGFSSRGKVDEV
jgi:hypothetical protein